VADRLDDSNLIDT